MSVVEKAGSPLEALIRKKKKALAGADASESGGYATFELDFEALSRDGHFNPDAPSSAIAKELRAVKRRLLRRLGFLRSSGERQAHRMPGRQRNLVLVTSSQAGEGKSFCAINLALSLAFEDQIETLLIDADVPRPKIAARLGLPEGPGFTDALIDGVAPGQIFHQAAGAPLFVASEGRSIPRASEVYNSPACKQFLTKIAANHHEGLVILDAPPALAMTDAVVLAKYVDEVVFVVEANETPQPAIASALDELLDVNPNVNLVLNRCLIGTSGASYNSYDYYGRTSPVDGEK